MAIFIGAIALLGSGSIEVGPSMLKNNLDITYAIVWLLALANVVGTLICIIASGGIARLTTIPFNLLAPFLFMIISFAAFQSGQDLMDLVALFAIGFLGILMRRFDWSRPAFLIDSYFPIQRKPTPTRLSRSRSRGSARDSTKESTTSSRRLSSS